MDASQPQARSKAFRTIFLIELWERFGYYGMAALLVLFMVQRLGFDDARANLTWGAFAALVYAMPAIGGWVGDRILGTRRTLLLGTAALALGYALMAVPRDAMLYIALGTVVVGNGLFKANSANMVRRIYEGDSARIDAAFTWYYIAVNVGSTMSQLLTPWIGARYGWHAAFAVCSIGLLLGLANYALLRRTLHGVGSTPDEQPVRWKALAAVLAGAVLLVFVVAAVLQHREVAVALVYAACIAVLAIFAWLIARGLPSERAGLVAALVLTLQVVLYFIFYQQMTTSLTLFALRNVDWQQSLFGIHLFTWIPAQYQVLDPIWIFILGPLLATLYTRLGRSGRDPSIASKFALGFAIVAAGFFVFAFSGASAVEGRVSSWYMVWGYALLALGELLVSGLGLAVMARYVPARMGGFMMGAYYVGVGVSQYLGSVVANYASVPDGVTDPVATLPIYTGLFLHLGYAACGAALLAILLLPLLRRLARTHAASAA
ncbi:MAG TPA: oligopeptide:H+ symporter [Luteimonas sp.]|jgi:POT family proton-dependent oligopeptide transporter|nr:oligopeptide:H+ symporter [Luteimonas sp.]